MQFSEQATILFDKYFNRMHIFIVTHQRRALVSRDTYVTYSTFTKSLTSQTTEDNGIINRRLATLSMTSDDLGCLARSCTDVIANRRLRFLWRCGYILPVPVSHRGESSIGRQQSPRFEPTTCQYSPVGAPKVGIAQSIADWIDGAVDIAQPVSYRNEHVSNTWLFLAWKHSLFDTNVTAFLESIDLYTFPFKFKFKISRFTANCRW